MSIWELRFSGINEYALLIPSDDEDTDLFGIFGTNGMSKHWPVPPRVEPALEKRSKAPKPRADISCLIPGAIILNQKAYSALNEFLLPFGQLLELDCKGEVEYFYNVTKQISCIDYEQSEKKGKSVIKEVFLTDALPSAPLIFKDPYTAKSRIYLNDAGKAKFEGLATAAGVFGARFVEAGQGLI